MNFGFVALQMVTVSLPILLGWAARKLGLMDDVFDTRLSALVLSITMPCMILASLGSSGGLPSASDMLWMLAGVTAMIVTALAIGYVLTSAMRVPKDVRGAYRFMVTFGNCGFIGFPVITAVYGNQALLAAAIGLIPSNLIIFTAGIMMFSGSGEGWRQTLRSAAECLKTPVLISSVVVAVCVALGIEGFGVLDESLQIVGNLTTPAALLLMGSSIAKYEPLSMLTNWRAYVAAAARLLIAPLVGLLILRLLPMPASILQVAVLETAMPVATNGTLYCLQYGVEPKPVMQGTFISIVASIVTIPLVVVLSQL